MFNKKNSILYLSSVVEEDRFSELVNSKIITSSFQAQKFNQLILKGLSEYANVIAVSNPVYDWEVLHDIEDITIRLENIEYRIVGYKKNKNRRLNNFLKIHSYISDAIKNYNIDYVVCDAINPNASLNAVVFSIMHRVPSIAILTDLPIIFSNKRKSVFTNLTDFLLRFYDGYVFLTQEMEHEINKRNKPYIIMEGVCDSKITVEPDGINQPKIDNKIRCLYSGSLAKNTGIELLIEAISIIKNPEYEFHFYGNGELSDYLSEKAAQDSRIVYHGYVENKYIVDAQRKASLLINPRPSNIYYGNVSFPSKIMEYMSSGTPVLSTRLPGIPDEYFNYMYVIDNESAGGIANSISYSISDIINTGGSIGQQARAFVIQNKNNLIQSKRILELAERCKRR